MRHSGRVACSIALTLLACSTARAQDPCDEPNEAVCDLQPPPEPGIPSPALALPPPTLVHPGYPPAAFSRPPWRLSVHLGVTSGITAMSVIFNDTEAAAFVGGDVRFLWRREGRLLGLGLRLSAFTSIGMHGRSNIAYNADGHTTDDGAGARLVGSELGFLMHVGGFWWSAGLGLVHVSAGSNDEIPVLPDFFAAVGYDLPLGRHLALRLQATGATLIVVNYGTLGGGVVARF